MQSYLKSKRGRPKILPYIRYAGEIDLWTKAQRAGGISFEMPTQGKAIAMVHSLNMARASVREQDGGTTWDMMVVRRSGTRVSIGSRTTIFDNPDIKFFDADGNPLGVNEIRDERFRQTQETERLEKYIDPNTPRSKPAPPDQINLNKPLRLNDE
jgi:hypothetical protein